MYGDTRIAVLFFLFFFMLLLLFFYVLNLAALILLTGFDRICKGLIVVVGVLLLEYLYLVCFIL